MSVEKPHLEPNVIMNIARLQRDHQFNMPYQLEDAAEQLFPELTEQQIEEAVNHCLTMIKRFAPEQ